MRRVAFKKINDALIYHEPQRPSIKISEVDPFINALRHLIRKAREENVADLSVSDVHDIFLKNTFDKKAGSYPVYAAVMRTIFNLTDTLNVDKFIEGLNFLKKINILTDIDSLNKLIECVQYKNRSYYESNDFSLAFGMLHKNGLLSKDLVLKLISFKNIVEVAYGYIILHANNCNSEQNKGIYFSNCKYEDNKPKDIAACIIQIEKSPLFSPEQKSKLCQADMDLLMTLLNANLMSNEILKVIKANSRNDAFNTNLFSYEHGKYFRRSLYTAITNNYINLSSLKKICDMEISSYAEERKIKEYIDFLVKYKSYDFAYSSMTMVQTVLLKTLMHHDIGSMQSIMDSAVDPNIVIETEFFLDIGLPTEASLLLIAVRLDDCDMIELLLSRGAVIKKEECLLHYTTSSVMTSYLINKGVSPDIQDGEGRTALMFEIQNSGILKRIAVLYEVTDPNRTDIKGNTLFHYVARYSDRVDLDLVPNDLINAQNSDGDTPLNILLSRKLNSYSIEILNAFIEIGAQFDIENKNKVSPKMKFLTVANQLVEHIFIYVEFVLIALFKYVKQPELRRKLIDRTFYDCSTGEIFYTEIFSTKIFSTLKKSKVLTIKDTQYLFDLAVEKNSLHLFKQLFDADNQQLRPLVSLYPDKFDAYPPLIKESMASHIKKALTAKMQDQIPMTYFHFARTHSIFSWPVKIDNIEKVFSCKLVSKDLLYIAVLCATRGVNESKLSYLPNELWQYIFLIMAADSIPPLEKLQSQVTSTGLNPG